MRRGLEWFRHPEQRNDPEPRVDLHAFQEFAEGDTVDQVVDKVSRLPADVGFGREALHSAHNRTARTALFADACFRLLTDLVSGELKRPAVPNDVMHRVVQRLQAKGVAKLEAKAVWKVLSAQSLQGRYVRAYLEQVGAQAIDHPDLYIWVWMRSNKTRVARMVEWFHDQKARLREE